MHFQYCLKSVKYRLCKMLYVGNNNSRDKRNCFISCLEKERIRHDPSIPITSCSLYKCFVSFTVEKRCLFLDLTLRFIVVWTCNQLVKIFVKKQDLWWARGMAWLTDKAISIFTRPSRIRGDIKCMRQGSYTWHQYPLATLTLEEPQCNYETSCL